MAAAQRLEPARTTSLSSGLTVVTETVPWARSVSLGVWLNAGSRHEADADSGITHFTEHMVFKGTERFTARDIACEIDGIGGHLDAFTTKEMTAFTALVLDEHWPRAFEIVSDMVQTPTLAKADIEREKGLFSKS
ncbi:MAG: insulinase family protein [Bryobacterales bacterium]|nr:insulinase family protein [Bryobacterales bacterium]